MPCTIIVTARQYIIIILLASCLFWPQRLASPEDMTSWSGWRHEAPSDLDGPHSDSHMYHITLHVSQMGDLLTLTISSISWREMYPLPSRSYMLNAHLSFCSSFPREVVDRAHKNSLPKLVTIVDWISGHGIEFDWIEWQIDRRIQVG